MKSILKTLGHVLPVAALVATIGVSSFAFDGAGETATYRGDRLNAPLSDGGDPDIRDMPVLGR